MYYVYILEFSDGDWYTGYTHDLKRRVYEHQAKQNTSTAHRGTFDLIYYEAYKCKMDAIEREKFLKSGAGKRFLKKQLKYHLEEDKIV